MGGSCPRIVVRHIIPNTIGTIIVNATFQVADAILLLAALGFIGLGVPAPLTDWGSMLADGVNSRSTATGGRSTRPGIAIVARRRRLQLRRRRVAGRLRGSPAAPLITAATAISPSRNFAALSTLSVPRSSRSTLQSGSRAGSGRRRGAPARTSRSGGSTSAQISWPAGSACGSGSPTAASIAEGSSPRTVHDLRAASRRPGRGSAIASISPRVYGCAARRRPRRRPDLDELAEVHDADRVGEVPDDREVVGDDDVGELVRRAAGRASG